MKVVLVSLAMWPLLIVGYLTRFICLGWVAGWNMAGDHIGALYGHRR